MQRKAFTLVECLVVIGILMTIVALLLPAIMRVRMLQLQMENKSNLRSISMAMLAYASDHQGSLPGIIKPPDWVPGDKLPMLEYVKYLAPESISGPRYYGLPEYPEVKAYRSPTDLSVLSFDHYLVTSGGLCSYAANMLIHLGRPRMSTSITDGLSNTIYVGEHLTLTGRAYYGTGSYFATNVYSMYSRFGINPDGSLDLTLPDTRHAVFANAAAFDVVPVTSGSPPVTVPSIPGVTFQHLPSWEIANSGLLHSTTSQGLLVGMCDGSTRIISPSVSPAVFWAAVTPSGNESIRWDDD